MGSAAVALAAGIYSLVAGAPGIPGRSHAAPEPNTTGTIPRILEAGPLPSRTSVFVKTSPSGNSAPAKTPSLRASAAPSAKPTVRSTPKPSQITTAPPLSLTAKAKAALVVTFLRAQLGKPYVYGGNGPLAYDCSGLVKAAFKLVGIGLPRTSEQQAHSGVAVSLRALQPGDILFWGSPATHSAVYVGNGEFIGAENPRLGVALEKLTWDQPSYARRVL